MRRIVVPATVPKVGDEIYVQTGDDVTGGLAEVTKVTLGMSAGKQVPFVEVKEQPCYSYNWPTLAAEQDKLSHRFGINRAYRDGYRP